MRLSSGKEFRDTLTEEQQFHSRLSVLSAFVWVMLGMLLLRFAYLQIWQHEHYHTLAEENRISLVPRPPARGLIVDRHGVVLAYNDTVHALEITPSKVTDIEQTINELGTIVDISARDRRRFKLLLEESKRYESLPIRSRLSEEEVARFAANRYRFPGVEIKPRQLRQYPLGAAFSHVVGYIGRMNPKELEALDDADQLANYRGTDHVGKSGIEQSYEALLHGTTGIEEVEIDAGGRAIRSLSYTQPVAGSNLKLALDAGLQAVVDKAFGERRGALVALDPQDGGVLAFVSKPGFDPNLFVDGIDPVSWAELRNSPERPMTNRALNGTYPPGSTFKPYMALAALTLGKRTPEQVTLDPGYFMFGNHQFRDDVVGGHGVVDMYRSIVASCDTYYYALANDLGIDAISHFMARFGFGSKSGIDLLGESVGVLPSPQWKMQRFKQKWYPGETISIGIGQGYNAYTPLQMATALATLANEGAATIPHVVETIEAVGAAGPSPRRASAPRALQLNPAHLAVIKKAMIGVNVEGTSAMAFQATSYMSAGKTGTAQVIGIKQGEKYEAGRLREQFHDHALFIAYAPAEKPTIALAVVVENAGFGAQAAAPIARAAFDYYLLGKPAPSLPAKGTKP